MDSEGGGARDGGVKGVGSDACPMCPANIIATCNSSKIIEVTS
jgi:hypothetical protein